MGAEETDFSAASSEARGDVALPRSKTPSCCHREALWMGIKRQSELGFPQKEIAKRFGVNVRTVRNYLHMPEGPRERHCPSAMDAFIPELKTLIEVCPHAPCAFYYRRLKQDGYLGSLSSVKRWVNKVAAILVSQKRQNSWTMIFWGCGESIVRNEPF